MLMSWHIGIRYENSMNSSCWWIVIYIFFMNSSIWLFALTYSYLCYIYVTMIYIIILHEFINLTNFDWHIITYVKYLYIFVIVSLMSDKTFTSVWKPHIKTEMFIWRHIYVKDIYRYHCNQFIQFSLTIRSLKRTLYSIVLKLHEGQFVACIVDRFFPTPL